MTEGEKVMRGLKACSLDDCGDCPYHEIGCVSHLCAHALGVIESLKKENESLTNFVQEQEKQLSGWEKYAPFLAAHGVLKEGEEDA